MSDTKEKKDYEVGNCRPPKHTRFSKDRQPRTRGKRSSVWKQIKELTGDDYKVALNKEQKFAIIDSLSEKSREELESIWLDKDKPIFVKLIAKAFHDAVKKGDVGILDKIWDRRYGRPVQESKVEHTSPDGTMSPCNGDIILEAIKRKYVND
jgi:hypothetical protein